MIAMLIKAVLFLFIGIAGIFGFALLLLVVGLLWIRTFDRLTRNWY